MKLKPLLLALLIATSTAAFAEEKIVIPIGGILGNLFGGSSETTQKPSAQVAQQSVRQPEFAQHPFASKNNEQWTAITSEQWTVIAPILQAASECRSTLPNVPEILALLKTEKDKKPTADFFKKAVIRGGNYDLNFSGQIRPADDFRAFGFPVEIINISRLIPENDADGYFSIDWSIQGRAIETIAKNEKIKLETGRPGQIFYEPGKPSHLTTTAGARKTKVGKLLLTYTDSDFKGNKKYPAPRHLTNISCRWWTFSR